MGQDYQCWWRICREINVSSGFEYDTFYFLYPFVPYLLTPSYLTSHFVMMTRFFTVCVVKQILDNYFCFRKKSVYVYNIR
jgi:hypothetical protein